jgi:hypothetical protein
VGDFETRALALVESTLKYHPYRVGSLTWHRDPVQGQWLVGSLTGAVASQRVTEAPNGALRLVGNQPLSVKAYERLTATHTRGADAKAGLSDRVVGSGTAMA